MRFIGVFDYTVVLTHFSLFSAIFGMIQAHARHPGAAILCLLFSGICDAFDGMVARSKKNRTEDEKSFGIQLDSLCDLVSFGAFPAFLCYTLGMNKIWGILILFLYCMCGASRLAFFNVEETKRQKVEGGANKIYRGLPITTSSMILPAVYLLHYILPQNIFVILLHVAVAATGFLFVLDISVRKADFRKLLAGKARITE